MKVKQATEIPKIRAQKIVKDGNEKWRFILVEFRNNHELLMRNISQDGKPYLVAGPFNEMPVTLQEAKRKLRHPDYQFWKAPIPQAVELLPNLLS